MSSTWFQCKISYPKRLEDGGVKKVSETYLFDAISFTEAEARVYEELSDQIPEFMVNSVSKTKYTNIYFFNDSMHWYKCKVVFSSVNADTGKEKKITEMMLLKADDIKDAFDKIKEKLRNLQLPAEITDIVQTPIVTVFPFRAQDERVPEGMVKLEDNGLSEDDTLDEAVDVYVMDEDEFDEEGEFVDDLNDEE